MQTSELRRSTSSTPHPAGTTLSADFNGDGQADFLHFNPAAGTLLVARWPSRSLGFDEFAREQTYLDVAPDRQSLPRAVDQDEDGIRDAFEQQLLDRYSPILRPHGTLVNHPYMSFDWFVKHSYIERVEWRYPNGLSLHPVKIVDRLLERPTLEDYLGFVHFWRDTHSAEGAVDPSNGIIMSHRDNLGADADQYWETDAHGRRWFVDVRHYLRFQLQRFVRGQDPDDPWDEDRAIREQAGVYGRVARPTSARSGTVVWPDDHYVVQFYVYMPYNETDFPLGAGNHVSDILALDLTVRVPSGDVGSSTIVSSVYHNHGSQIIVPAESMDMDGTHPRVYLELGSNEFWPIAGGERITLPPRAYVIWKDLADWEKDGIILSELGMSFWGDPFRKHEGTGREYRTANVPNVGESWAPIGDAAARLLLTPWKLNSEKSPRTPFYNGGQKMWDRKFGPAAGAAVAATIAAARELPAPIAAHSSSVVIAGETTEMQRSFRLRSTDDLSALRVGQRFRVSVDLNGLSADQLALLGVSVRFDPFLLATASSPAVGPLVPADGTSVKTHPGFVDAAFFAGATAISSDGTFYTFELTAIRPGRGMVSFEPGSAFAGTGAPATVPVGAGEGLAYNVIPANVAARYVFYNRSALDGNNAAATPADDNAIASDKHALLPGETPRASNYTAYSRGINGLMLDFAALPVTAPPAADDFLLEVNDGRGGWRSVAASPSVSIRRGEGTSGTDRITLILPDHAVRNTWLRVTIKATGGTGLSSPDVFYFGNLVDDTGGPGTPRVDVIDLARTCMNLGRTTAAALAQSDFNRDGRVNALDVGIVRSNQRRSLPLFVAPAGISGASRRASFGKVPVSPVRPLAPPPARRGVLEVPDPGLLA